MIDLVSTGTYLVNDLYVNDSVGYEVLSRSIDPEEDIRTALRIGMRFLHGVAAAGSVVQQEDRILELIRSEFASAANDVHKRVTEQLTMTHTAVTSAVTDGHRALEHRTSLHQTEIERKVSDGINASLGVVSRQLHDTVSEASILLASTGRVVERQSTAKRGADYETVVNHVVDRYAKSRGGVYEETGTIPGPDGRTKTGDGVLTLFSPSQRLVVEAKSKKGSLNYYQAEAVNARANRRAAGCIVLVDSARWPSTVAGSMARLSPTDLLVRYDIDFNEETDSDDDVRLSSWLDVLSTLVEIETWRQSKSSAGTFDLDTARHRIESCVAQANSIDEIVRTLNLSRSHLSKSLDSVEALRRTLSTELQLLHHMLQSDDS